jgi:acid phosphatase family membrane protein YuiD
MKKILGTTLIAVAFAMVNTVDAKVMKRAGGQKGAVAASQDVAMTAVNAVDMSASSQDIKAAQNDVADVLSEDNLSADEREYATLVFQLQDTKNRIAFRKAQLADLKYGLFGFITASQETRDQRNRINKIISNLENDKKQIESDMATLKPVVGDKFVKAMWLLVAGVTVTITASFVDQYFGGKGSAYIMKKGGEAYEYVKTSRVGQAAGEYAGRAAATGRYYGNKAVEAGKGAYNRMRGTAGTAASTATVTEPTYNLPEYR